MPIYTVKMMRNLAKVCGATITQPIEDGLAKLPPDDKKAVVQLGIEFSTEQCRGLLEKGVAGLHFYTMNRSKSVCAILETLRSEGRL
jgi:methylenetetrahydrofolate reductase (NADPH)